MHSMHVAHSHTLPLSCGFLELVTHLGLCSSMPKYEFGARPIDRVVSNECSHIARPKEQHARIPVSGYFGSRADWHFHRLLEPAHGRHPPRHCGHGLQQARRKLIALLELLLCFGVCCCGMCACVGCDESEAAKASRDRMIKKLCDKGAT